MQIIDDASVSAEPVTAQERSDLADERNTEAWHAIYAAIVEERKAKGLPDQPIVIVAEIARWQRAAKEDAE